MAVLQIDAILHNADWTKQTRDLPTGKGIKQFLKRKNIKMADFKKLPAYYLPKRKTKE